MNYLKKNRMTNKFPNASILTIITQNDGSNEKLLFIYLKTIPDHYPSNGIHWYDGAGKDGKPNNVWDKLAIKQWTGCGKDSVMLNLFNDLLEYKKLCIGSKKIPLIIPQHKVIINSDDPFISRSGNKFDSLVTENNTLIPKEFYQKENLQFLSAFKNGSTEIKPLFPLGFFEDNFINDNLKNGIWGIKEYRTAYLTFHGVRKTSEKGIGSKEMVGFYQQNFNLKSKYVAVVKNQNEQEIGKAIIDSNTGFFKIQLTEPTKSGKVEIWVDDKEEKAIKYALLQEIEIEGHIANATFKDAYGRSHMITSDNKTRPENVSNFTWQQNVYADKREANQKLSDLFKSIFDYLGPKILIADPYFFGEIKEDNVTAELHLKDDQIAFINAITHSALEKGISKLNFLGYWGRARNQLANDWITKYQKFFKGYLVSNNFEKYFPSSTIEFFNAQNEFHARYWFSLVYQDGIEVIDRCVIITNSIGNMSELDIILVTDESQLKQIIRQYTGIFKNSQLKLSV
jgi:hypothetical protein